MGKYVQIDPYANAFTLDYRVWEQKFELDSLAYPIDARVELLEDDRRHDRSSTPISRKMLDATLATMQREQDHPRNSSYTHKELANDGKGRPVGYTGMIWTGFRPSDDACYYNFLIPSEMFAVVALGDMAEIERDVYHNVVKAREAQVAARRSAARHSNVRLVLVPKYGYIYAYEVDGLGPRDPHRRRQHSEPALGAVHRLHHAERPLLR